MDIPLNEKTFVEVLNKLRSQPTGFIFWQDLIRMVDVLNWSRDIVEEVTADWMDNGTLYEPKIGFIDFVDPEFGRVANV